MVSEKLPYVDILLDFEGLKITMVGLENLHYDSEDATDLTEYIEELFNGKYFRLPA